MHRHAPLSQNTENMWYCNADNDSALDLFEPLFESGVSSAVCDASMMDIDMMSAQAGALHD